MTWRRWYEPGVRHQCLQQSRSIVETEFRGGDSSVSSATLEMLEDEMMTEVLVLTQIQAQAWEFACDPVRTISNCCQAASTSQIASHYAFAGASTPFSARVAASDLWAVHVQEVYAPGDRWVDGAAEAGGFLPEAPSAAAAAFRVVSHIRWHGEALRDTSRIRLFVGVLTGGANADRRAAIRETWGKDKRLHRCRPLHARPH